MPGTLILLRHGQSKWNLENRFTGWVDVDLTDRGRREAIHAGTLLRGEGLTFDAAHVSVLRRAISTLNIVLDVMEQQWIPVSKTWRLNERHYGALQGLNKAETAAEHGEEQVRIWRRSYDVPPPPMPASDASHPRNDRRYRGLDARVLPDAESLADTLNRVLPYWDDAVAPQLKFGATVLLVAHGNSIRAIYKYLNDISESEIVGLNIPTGIPLCVTFDEALNVRELRYLGDPEVAKAAAEHAASSKG